VITKPNQEAFKINLFNGGIGGFVARAQKLVVLVTY
jgi:hypothetical protein